jgi:integrase
VKYLVTKTKRGKLYRYWIPKTHYLVAGKPVKCPLKATKLPDDPIQAHKRAEELNELLDAWRNGKDAKRHIEYGTVDWLIAEYKKDTRFKELRETTRKLYGYGLEDIRAAIGDIPVDKVSRIQARALYQSFPNTSRKASQVMQVARLLFNLARDMGIIVENPFKEQRVTKPKPRQAIWPSELIAKAKEKAIDMGLPSIALAIQMGLDTAQRPSDLRGLTWGNYTGSTLRLRQSKTRVWVEIPIMPELKAMLDSAQESKASPSILVCEDTGKPYNKDMLSRKIREVCEAAGIGAEYQFRDLRRTSVVRLAEHGCEIQEICAITGHSLKEASQILEVYMPRTSKMAENAIAKLQKL